MQLTTAGKVLATVLTIGVIGSLAAIGGKTVQLQRELDQVNSRIVVPDVPLTMAPTVTATPSATATPTIKAVFYAPTKAIQK